LNGPPVTAPDDAVVVYLSGPMTGMPDYNYPAFNDIEAAIRWSWKGPGPIAVINPARNFDGFTGHARHIYMREDVAGLLRATCLMVLPGWDTSRGATLEVAIARELGLPVCDTDWREIADDPAEQVMRAFDLSDDLLEPAPSHQWANSQDQDNAFVEHIVRPQLDMDVSRGERWQAEHWQADNSHGHVVPSTTDQLDRDFMLYGNAYTVDGKRVNPTRVQVFTDTRRPNPWAGLPPNNARRAVGIDQGLPGGGDAVNDAQAQADIDLRTSGGVPLPDDTPYDPRVAAFERGRIRGRDEVAEEAAQIEADEQAAIDEWRKTGRLPGDPQTAAPDAAHRYVLSENQQAMRDADPFGLNSLPPLGKPSPGWGEVRETDPTTGGEKGAKLAELGAVDPLALWHLARVAGFGGRKYSRGNYMRGYRWSLSYDAMMRHALAFWMGEEHDTESGAPHMAAAAWHACALVSFSERHLGSDDRYDAVEPVE